MQSLFISPESYSDISVMVLPLSVHAEYPCVPLGSLMLGNISPSKKIQENAIFLAHLQILLYLCNRKPKVCRHIKKRLLRGPHNFKQWGVFSACFGNLKTGNFHPIQSKKAVNARWDMDYPAAERPCVDCSVWWLFIFGVGVACLFL